MSTEFNKLVKRLGRQGVDYNMYTIYDNYIVVCYRTKWLHKSRHRYFNRKGEEITWYQMHKEVEEKWD